MRKISEESTMAFINAKPFKLSNTEIKVLPNVTIMLLHNNPIAYLYNDPERILSVSNGSYTGKWSDSNINYVAITNTTKERLNSIPGVRIWVKKGVTYLNGNIWNGELIDVK